SRFIPCPEYRLTGRVPGQSRGRIKRPASDRAATKDNLPQVLDKDHKFFHHTSQMAPMAKGGGPGQRTGTLWVVLSTGHLFKGPLARPARSRTHTPATTCPSPSPRGGSRTPAACRTPSQVSRPFSSHHPRSGRPRGTETNRPEPRSLSPPG